MKLVVENVGKQYRRDFWGLSNFSLGLAPGIAHVNPMLALRNILCSDRWQENWPKIEARLRLQSHQRRTTVHQTHHPKPPSSLIARALQGDFGKPFPEQSAQEPNPPRKNPWRNFKHGKALFQRPHSPKIHATPCQNCFLARDRADYAAEDGDESDSD